MTETNEELFDLDISWHEIENEIKYTIKMNLNSVLTKEEAILLFKDFRQTITQLILPYFTESNDSNDSSQ